MHAGTLPTAWGSNTTSLRTLDLSRNMLTGFFPASWDRIVYASADVRLGSNALQGPLPSSWLVANATYPTTASPLARLDLRSVV